MNRFVVVGTVRTFATAVAFGFLWVVAASYATAQPDTADKRTTIMLLGTGGGPPIQQIRSRPSTLLTSDGRKYLIDAGSGTLQRLEKAGAQVREIDAIFITHNHLDHYGGLAEVISYGLFRMRAKPVDVLGPAGTADNVAASVLFSRAWRRALGAERVPLSPDPATIYRAKEISDGGIVFEDGVIKVTAVDNSHYHLQLPSAPGSHVERSFAYRIDTRDRSIVFTGDTGPSEAVAKLAAGADVLISEVVDLARATDFAVKALGLPPEKRKLVEDHMAHGHLTPEEIGKLAAQAQVKMVILHHFVPGHDNETSTAPYVEGIQKFYKGPVVPGKDLDVF